MDGSCVSLIGEQVEVLTVVFFTESINAFVISSMYPQTYESNYFPFITLNFEFW